MCAYELAQVVHVTLDLHTGAGSSCLLGCASARAAAASVFNKYIFNKYYVKAPGTAGRMKRFLEHAAFVLHHSTVYFEFQRTWS